MPLVLVDPPTPQERLDRIAQAMREARVGRGLTVTGAAERAGVAVGVVRRIEHAQNVEVLGLLAVAQLLGIAIVAEGG